MADKITHYMRVTKRKTPETKKGASHKSAPHLAPSNYPQSSRAPAAAAVKKPAPTSTSHEPQEHHYYRDEYHVPEFIYKIVKYVRRGQGGKVSKDELAVVKYIEVPERRTVVSRVCGIDGVTDFGFTHYRIPSDFERDHRFGPHSGLTFEKRLLRAYSLKLLKSKDQSKAPETICTTCAQLGHFHRDCPDGF